MIEYIFVPNAVQSTQPVNPAPAETVSTNQAVQQTTQTPNLPSSIAPPEALSIQEALPPASTTATSKQTVSTVQIVPETQAQSEKLSPSSAVASPSVPESSPPPSAAASLLAPEILPPAGTAPASGALPNVPSAQVSNVEPIPSSVDSPAIPATQPALTASTSNRFDDPQSPALPSTAIDAVAARQKVIEQRLQEIVSRHRQRLATTAAPAAPIQTPTQTAMVSPTEKPTTINSLANLPYGVEVLAILRVIVQQESSGNHRAVNRHSGALGYGQVMPSNLPSWSQAALGRRVSRREFLNQPAIQLQIIGHRLNQYWRTSLASSNGDEAIAVRKVASLWYSGRANLFDSTASQYYGGYRYPSIAEYTLRVLRRYQVEKQSLLASNWRNQGAF